MKILVVKLGALGDIIFTTPLIRTLKKNIPESKISYLTIDYSKDVAENIPYLDEVITFKNPFLMLPKIRSRKFDTVFILHRKFVSNLFFFLCGIPERIGFDYKNQGLFLTKKIKFDETKHEVDRYLDLTLSIGIKPYNTETELNILEYIKNDAKRILEDNNIKTDDLKIAILPGGGNNPGTYMPIKRLPEEKLVELSKRLIKEFNAKIIFIGDNNDLDITNRIVSLINSKQSVNLCGKTTKKQMLGVLSEMDLFIGADSGPLHIAASIGISTIGIFGPSDPKLVGPRGYKHRYIWKKPECSPCYNPISVMDNKDFSVCSTGTLECMKKITVDEIFELAKELINKYARK